MWGFCTDISSRPLPQSDTDSLQPPTNLNSSNRILPCVHYVWAHSVCQILGKAVRQRSLGVFLFWEGLKEIACSCIVMGAVGLEQQYRQGSEWLEDSQKVVIEVGRV